MVTHGSLRVNPFTPKILLISNSYYCLLYNSHKVSLKNFVLDQLIIPKLIFLLNIIITCLLGIVRRNSVLVTMLVDKELKANKI